MEAKKILIDKNKFLRESGVNLENYTPEQVLLWVTRAAETVKGLATDTRQKIYINDILAFLNACEVVE